MAEQGTTTTTKDAAEAKAKAEADAAAKATAEVAAKEAAEAEAKAKAEAEAYEASVRDVPAMEFIAGDANIEYVPRVHAELGLEKRPEGWTARMPFKLRAGVELAVTTGNVDQPRMMVPGGGIVELTLSQFQAFKDKLQ